MHDDDPVGRALRDLPRAKASNDFTHQVLARVAQDVDAAEPDTRATSSWTRAAVAALVVAGLGATAWWQSAQQAEADRVAADLARVEAQHRLEAERRIAEDRARLDALHQHYQQQLQQLSQGHRSPFLAPGTVGFDLDGRARLLAPPSLGTRGGYAPVGYRTSGD